MAGVEVAQAGGGLFVESGGSVSSGKRGKLRGR